MYFSISVLNLAHLFAVSWCTVWSCLFAVIGFFVFLRWCIQTVIFVRVQCFVLHLNVAVRISSTVRCFKSTKLEHNILETECFISHISRLQDAQYYSPLRRIFPHSVDKSSPGISQHNRGDSSKSLYLGRKQIRFQKYCDPLLYCWNPGLWTKLKNKSTYLITYLLHGAESFLRS